MSNRKRSRPTLDTYLTPAEIAASLRVSPDKVIAWIRRAELVAVNVGEAGRSQYRVSPHYLHEFLKAREVPRPQPRCRTRARRQPPPGGPLDPDLGEKLLKKGEAVKYGNAYLRVWEGIVLYF